MKLDETSTRSIPVQQQDITSVRQRLKRRLETHGRILYEEIERLTAAAAELGAQRVILFGSLVEKEPGLTTDLDLLIVWDSPLPFIERTAEVYRRLQPRVGADLLVYTPEEMERMVHNSLVRRALKEGRVLYEA